MNSWQLLITSLPTGNATVRMRVWRTLKASGAAVLHDGVYLMPECDPCVKILNEVATEVRAGGGSALVLRAEQPADEAFEHLFDRSTDYAALLADLVLVRDALTADSVMDALKHVRKLRKNCAAIVSIDYFPGESRRQAEAAIQELELACARILSPDEPQPQTGQMSPLQIADFQHRLWATRRRPWVDRLASAWLIQRFIDPHAQFLWLASPQDCPPDALGFDFDGATFTHVGNRVTFEVLLTRFGLQQPALNRIAALVHYLDVGGVQPPEAAGVESVLAGLRDAMTDDEQLLHAAHAVFDGLLTTFSKGFPS